MHSEEIGPAAAELLDSGFKSTACATPAAQLAEGGAAECSRAMSRRASLISYKKSGRADEELAVSRRFLRSGLNG